MRHLYKDNFCLITNREQKIGNFDSVFISKDIVDLHIVDNGSYCFPLYESEEENSKKNKAQKILIKEKEKTPNLNQEILEKIASTMGLTFTPEPSSKKNSFCPLDLLDYIYAVLYSPPYRETYQAFLKIDFPRIPYPKNKEIFFNYAKLGKILRELHLLNSSKLEKIKTTFPETGTNIIEKIAWQPANSKKEQDKVWINKEQYFANVSKLAWEFTIGGYQPAQKWLKSRKEKKLDYDDIAHYQKIIASLTETDKITAQLKTIPLP